jgi:membrane-associated protease RseP (regulator of RpoE activity)
MQLKKPARLPVALALAATTALSFGGGVMWNSAAQTAAAAEAPATQHGWLGMRLAPSADGPTVADVVAGGPAAKAGIQKGDVIKSLNGTATTADPAAMRTVMQNIKPGDVVQVGITRNGAAQTIAVTAATPPAGQQGPGGPGHRGGHRGGMGFGMPNLLELKDIPADQRFDHMLGGSFSITDKDGKKVTVRIIPAKVVSATDTEVVVTPNGGTSNSTFKITSDTKIPGKGSDLPAPRWW